MARVWMEVPKTLPIYLAVSPVYSLLARVVLKWIDLTLYHMKLMHAGQYDTLIDVFPRICISSSRSLEFCRKDNCALQPSYKFQSVPLLNLNTKFVPFHLLRL